MERTYRDEGSMEDAIS